MTEGLRTGVMKVEDIEPIRVTKYQGLKYFISLDNQRLRALKDAKLDRVPVWFYPFHQVEHEFHSKYNAAEIDGGGRVRSNPSPNSYVISFILFFLFAYASLSDRMIILKVEITNSPKKS